VGVNDGNAVLVFVGEAVIVAVQVGGSMTRGVGVLVGSVIVAGSVGGGNGFNDPDGSKKIIKDTHATHNTVNKTNIVRTFQMMAEFFLVLSTAKSSL